MKKKEARVQTVKKSVNQALFIIGVAFLVALLVKLAFPSTELVWFFGTLFVFNTFSLCLAKNMNIYLELIIASIMRQKVASHDDIADAVKKTVDEYRDGTLGGEDES